MVGYLRYVISVNVEGLVRFHICSVWGKAWFGINDPSWLELLKQSTIYNTGFSQEGLTKDAIGKARCMNHHDPMNMRTSQNKNQLPSSQWLDQTCTSIQVGERKVHWFHLRMESNKTITCTKWSNQVKLIQTINRINSKSSAMDQKFSVGNLHSFHGIKRRSCCIRSSCPANLQVFLTAFSTCKPNAHRSSWTLNKGTQRANHSTFTT